MSSVRQSVSTVNYTLIGAFGLFALALTIASLSWEYTRDTPLLNYVGYLIWDHGFTPYRDVFETSMPGTLAFHSFIAGTGLAANLAFSLFSLVIVTGFALLGALLILPMGRAGALIAFPLILSTMLMMGPGWLLKIDMVALLPISAALCCAIWQRPAPILLRQCMIGFLFGIAGTMKPHLMLGAPIAVLAAFVLEYGTGRLRNVPVRALIVNIAASLAGFAAPMLALLIWLISSGAYDSFVFVLTQYLPLHLEKTDWQAFLPEAERKAVKFSIMMRFGGNYPLVPLCALAALLALTLRKKLDLRDIVIMVSLCLLSALYGLAPGLGGQFYVYYYFPFFFFCLVLVSASISLSERIDGKPVFKALWSLGMAGVLIFHGWGLFYPDAVFGKSRLDSVSAMEDALIKWLPEDGRVQPIDWTSGVVYAMLRQEILPATPYLYDYHFHHHVGGGINTGLRQAFMSALEANPPDLFMEARDFPRVSGVNTTERFAERDAFVAENYRVVQEHPVFQVYLRNDLPKP